jgi:AraC-like DNA-binding protein
MQTWTSLGQRTGDPFGRWSDDLAQAFVRLEPRRIVDRRFFGRIAKTGGGPIDVSLVEAAGHQVARLKEHAARATGDLVFVNLQLAGIGLTRQHGKDLRTQPLDLVVADTASPFQIVHRDAFSLYCLALPRRLVPPSLLDAGALHLSADDAGRHHARMMATYAGLLLDRRTAAAERETYGRHMVDLLAICGGHLSDWDGAPAGGSARLPLLLDFLRQNHRDRDLSAATAARVFGISSRYVHKLFATTGKSFSEHLGEIRLDECARRLGASRAAIIDVALDAGFSDISYFNRRFKARFGETPRDYRRRRQD